MISNIKTAWMGALTANTYPPAELKIHPNVGFDPLGVLCELFRVSTYTMVAGSNTSALSLLTNLFNTRQALYVEMQGLGVAFTLDPTLVALITAPFWATNSLNPDSKCQIKVNFDAMALEDYEFSLVVGGGLDAEYAAYRAALASYTAWLDTLVHPGGWASYVADWETAPWVWNAAHTSYSMNNVSDVLPEAVQRWSELLTANPYLQLTDSMIGTSGQARLTELIDGIVLKKVGTASRRYTYDEVVALLNAQLTA